MTDEEKSELAFANRQRRRKENHRDYLIAKGEDVIDEESEDEDES